MRAPGGQGPIGITSFILNPTKQPLPAAGDKYQVTRTDSSKPDGPSRSTLGCPGLPGATLTRLPRALLLTSQRRTQREGHTHWDPQRLVNRASCRVTWILGTSRLTVREDYRDQRGTQTHISPGERKDGQAERCEGGGVSSASHL